jgi:Asp-tRNA(Asn)/Glu-tRNA(Gln) amidotransferase A subunit family amidase
MTELEHLSLRAWTLWGVPAPTLPVGFSARDMPLGLQIVGTFQYDARLLHGARWIEQAVGFAPGPRDDGLITEE